ncbi:hypothetical protein ABW21_db0201476 [Orbilia brochopaga]|nr:hypothetical protein ABW21_db0201476 [Drechslerella brochopaga]
MSVRIRRYVPSFKRRKLDGGSGPTFLGAAAGDDVRAQPDRVRDTTREGDARLARRARDLQHQADTILELQRHRRRHVAKRADGDGRPDDTTDPAPEIPTDGNDQGSGNGVVTVTISVGLTLQFNTITSAGSTFVSISTSIFTISPSPNTSSSIPVPTAAAASFVTSSTSSSAASLIPRSSTTSTSATTPTSTATASSSLTSLTIPTSTFASIPTSRQSVPAISAPLSFSTGAPVTSSLSSIIPTISSNMTVNFQSLRSTRSTSRTTSLFSERTTIRSSSRSSITTTSRSLSQTSTRITTSILTSSTVFPAESEPTTPLDSPTTPTVDTDKGTDVATSNNNSINDKLPPILGGVFGGLAGIGLVLWALLFLMRRRRRNGRGGMMLDAGGGNGHQRAISAETGAGSTGDMSQAQTSLMPAIFGTAAGLFGGRSSADTAPPKEQGFVKIAGRKLPSAYDNDMVPTSIAVANARASVSEGGSRNVSGGTQPTVAPSASTRESISHDDEAIMQAPIPTYFPPSSARSAMRTGSPALGPAIEEDEPEGISGMPAPPLIHEPTESSSRFGTPPPGAVRRMHSLVGTDGVGRSLASQDGSKTSRFTEDV